MRNVVLHMGFLNVPYTRDTKRDSTAAIKKYEAMRRRTFSGARTTGTVANILERKYNIVEVFAQIHGGEIQDILVDNVGDLIIDSLSQRKKFASERMVKYMKPKTDQIQKMFKLFLDREETGADIDVANKGRRTGRKSKTPRPPFINTGLYRASFRCWADIK
jgi:hypothetical protein